MKKHQTVRHYIFFTLAFLFFVVSVEQVAALEVPKLTSRINDYAGILSSVTTEQLEKSLKSFEESQSTQIVVLTVPSLENDSLEEFSMRVAEVWKIGQKGKDNGAILLVSRNDRKIRIEVGYGLEGTLTDLISGRIIRNVIVPHFKQGDFDKGIMAGVDAMMKTVEGEFSADDIAPSPSSGDDPAGFLFMLIFFLLGIGKVLGHNKFLAGTVGGVVASAVGLVTIGPKWLIILLLFPVGAILAIIASGFALTGLPTSSGRGGYGGYRGSGGGFSGGFGGGGGGFGGGGASGGW